MTSDSVEAEWQPSDHELLRRSIRRQQAWNRRFLAFVITVLVLTLLVVGLVLSPGWDRVKETFFDPEHARAVLPLVRDAFWLNIKMFLMAEVFILLVGAVVAVIRVSVTPWLAPLRVLATAYVDICRGVPTLLLIALLGFGVPALELQGLTKNPIVWATVALVLSYGAYVAEVFRAGIESIHPSQVASAEALGLSRPQILRRVVLPQAVRRVAPPLLNDFISLQKDTSLVSTLGIVEALRVANNYGLYHFNYTGLVVAACFFIALTIPLARFTDWLGRRALQRERGQR